MRWIHTRSVVAFMMKLKPLRHSTVYVFPNQLIHPNGFPCYSATPVTSTSVPRPDPAVRFEISPNLPGNSLRGRFVELHDDNSQLNPIFASACKVSIHTPAAREHNTGCRCRFPKPWQPDVGWKSSTGSFYAEGWFPCRPGKNIPWPSTP
jgi:hypothetical protein